MAKKSSKGKDGGLHEMPSGLYHTADSYAGGKRGTFVDRFGPPGDPTQKAHPASSASGMDLGKAPNLLKMTNKGRQQNNG